MASTNTSSSTFTRYSNQSMRSVSTFATSVSASSASSNWRKQSCSALASTSSLASSLNSNNGSQSSHVNGMPRRPPMNVKRMYFSADALLLPGIHLLIGLYYSTKRCSVGAQWCHSLLWRAAAGARTQAYCPRRRKVQTIHHGYGRQKRSRTDK
jgi:hypothetical protein